MMLSTCYHFTHYELPILVILYKKFLNSKISKSNTLFFFHLLTNTKEAITISIKQYDFKLYFDDILDDFGIKVSTVYGKTLEGENFHGFHGFLANRESFPLESFAVYST